MPAVMCGVLKEEKEFLSLQGILLRLGKEKVAIHSSFGNYIPDSNTVWIYTYI